MYSNKNLLLIKIEESVPSTRTFTGISLSLIVIIINFTYYSLHK